ncbi:hypothetical protein H4W80_010624 [Nonomuraea angiospora]|uniref:Uncharacterized protein n=1 Tax=Nonomuraea angiospora TaxID=46172 RepID=A0ABR9MHE6_9ACTN|nr:hypothetical protein [Nonomuraea angiospora]
MATRIPSHHEVEVTATASIPMGTTATVIVRIVACRIR